MAEPLELLDDLLGRARRAGADAADALYFEAVSLGVSWRLGRLEDLERSETRDLGLRVFVGSSPAIVSSSEIDSGALDRMVERAIGMARVAPPDPYAGLADSALLETAPPDLDLLDPVEPDPQILFDRAAAAEAAAMAVEGVTNSEGAGASWGTNRVALATTGGFAGEYTSSMHGFSVSVLAGSGTAMERDYDYCANRHAEDLEDAATVGKRAGEKTVRRLNPRKMGTAQVPVVFDPRVSASMLGHLVGAINGAAIARGTSFLKDFLGKPVFGPGITIVDDPFRRRGHRSRPFDGEGVRCTTRKLIDQGMLTTWLMDSAAARQLGLASTGSAARGTSGPPGAAAANLHMEPGTVSPKDLIGDIERGFYVTEMIGSGVNGITGDYSRGAAGFWIEKGEIVFPVSEMTIAGNLKDMFRNMTPADDLVFRFGANAPTLRVDGMTVAGSKKSDT
ncbi:metallopeptidase TldD-related protein [Zavarzinia compransoris]|uniref:TldD/PmbA family protein n=1 Tax=Zavarzinia marina TaxID=2911065 RepID=UPI001F1DBFF1|nr:metallopeptidase TldD-related protein [Zavarzinia marina]MCF4164151.1 metallopeptidase TldD-related protein [Zavarzinia marina]